MTRCHTPKHSCKNCFEEFSSPHCRDDHIKAERCEKRKEPPPGRIAPKVSEELRSRKKTRRYQNDKDKWIEIYSRLFPGRPIPSPCKCSNPQFLIPEVCLMWWGLPEMVADEGQTLNHHRIGYLYKGSITWRHMYARKSNKE